MKRRYRVPVTGGMPESDACLLLLGREELPKRSKFT